MKRLFIHNPFFRILTPPVYGVLVYLIILLINNNVEQITTLVSNQEVYVSIAMSLIAFESMRLTTIGAHTLRAGGLPGAHSDESAGGCVRLRPGT